MSKVTLIASDPVPPSPFRHRDPPGRHATLTVYSIGPNPERAVSILMDLTELPAKQVRYRFLGLASGQTPVTVTLPGTSYDADSGLFDDLRRSGVAFSATIFAWVCPQELTGDAHSCTGTCSVVQIAEVVS